jgi:HAMP domain-containing protein
MLSLSDWRYFVSESTGLLVVISLVRTMLPALSDSSGSGSMPHPFWIPVLLMSGQYGIMGGLFATLAATAALFVNGLPPQSATQDFYAYAGVIAVQPCAWFATALVLGGLRTLHIHQQTELQQQFDRAQMAAKEVADGLEHAVTEIERLEQRIASDSSTLAAFLQSLAKLELRDRKSLLTSIANVVRYGVGATSFTIYLNTTHGLEPYLGVEDGSRLTSTAIPLPPPSLVHEAPGRAKNDATVARDDDTARTLHWAPIRLGDAAEPLGVVVCNSLLPSQDPAVAKRRLSEVCRVLAMLLSVCPETVSGA